LTAAALFVTPFAVSALSWRLLALLASETVVPGGFRSCDSFNSVLCSCTGVVGGGQAGLAHLPAAPDVAGEVSA